MASKTLPETVPALDPIDRLISRGVKVRQLVQLSPTAAEWLATHQDDTFRLCYFDAAGAVVSEDVTAVSLIQRAAQLGWNPDAEKSSEPHPYLFDEPVYHCRRGVHYYATATDERSWDCLPLCLPKSVLDAAARRHQRNRAKAKRKQAAETRRNEAQRKREEAEAHKTFMHQMAGDEIKLAKKAGRTIAYSTAMKRARIFVNDLCKSISEKLNADAASNKADAEANQGAEA